MRHFVVLKYDHIQRSKSNLIFYGNNHRAFVCDHVLPSVNRFKTQNILFCVHLSPKSWLDPLKYEIVVYCVVYYFLECDTG